MYGRTHLACFTGGIGFAMAVTSYGITAAIGLVAVLCMIVTLAAQEAAEAATIRSAEPTRED